MKVSIVVPVYNSEKTIRKCLNSLMEQTYDDCEIIVVDNNSTDNTKKIVREFDKIKCVFEPVPGRGAARNTGEKHTDGEIIVMTDSDCVAYPNWVSELVNPIIRNECDAVQGSEESMADDFWSAHIQNQHSRKEKDDNIIGMIDTKNFAISINALKKIGFTSRKYMSGNDTELSIRFKKNNLRLKFLSDVEVKHFHPNSFKKVVKKYFYRAAWCTKITRDYEDYLKHTSFLSQTNQTAWTFFKFFPGLFKTMITRGIGDAYFDFVSGIAWRAGLIWGKLK